MSSSAFLKRLDKAEEINITVIGRRSGKPISTPVWFVYERNVINLLPVSGSKSNWYRNLMENPQITLTSGNTSITAKARTIADKRKVRDVVDRFKAKYGSREVVKWYTRFDACIEISLPS